MVIDHSDFEQLTVNAINYCRPYIYGRYSISDEDFKDARQNAMIKSWKYIDSFRGDSSFNTWFLKILKNEVLSIITSNKRRKENFIGSLNDMLCVDCDDLSFEDLYEEADSETKTPLHILEEKEKNLNYRRLIDYVYQNMDKKYSEIMKLALEKGMSYHNISAKIGIPTGTVMSRLFTARFHAKNIIKSHINDFFVEDFDRRLCNSICE